MNIIITRSELEEALQGWLKEKGLQLDSKLMKLNHKDKERHFFENFIVSVTANKSPDYLNASYFS